MKLSSTLFIAFLFAVSCSNNLLNFKPTDEEIDNSLIELNKEPITEGIFATMATQLSTEGGFNRILALLHQLVADGKKQLHGITKTWRGVSARCQVTKFKLGNRQEFFESHLSHLRDGIRHATLDNADLEGSVQYHNKAIVAYTAILKYEVAKHVGVANYNKKMLSLTKSGLSLIKTAENAIKDWTPEGAALVQTSLRTLVESYAKITSHSLDQPTELLQRSGTDAKVRARFQQWLTLLKIRFVSAAGHYTISKGRAAKFKLLESTLAKLIASLQAENKQLRAHIGANKTAIAAHTKFANLLAKLARENLALIKANTAYCNNESTRFHAGQKRIRGEIALFREIIRYFRNHYNRVHSFIRNKYNRN